jgi:hypothetical protein
MQMVEYLLSKLRPLSSNPSTTKNCQMQFFPPVIPSLRRLRRQKDCLNPGVTDQPREHSEILSQKKKKFSG